MGCEFFEFSNSNGKVRASPAATCVSICVNEKAFLRRRIFFAGIQLNFFTESWAFPALSNQRRWSANFNNGNMREHPRQQLRRRKREADAYYVLELFRSKSRATQLNFRTGSQRALTVLREMCRRDPRWLLNGTYSVACQSCRCVFIKLCRTLTSLAGSLELSENFRTAAEFPQDNARETALFLCLSKENAVWAFRRGHISFDKKRIFKENCKYFTLIFSNNFAHNSI